MHTHFHIELEILKNKIRYIKDVHEGHITITKSTIQNITNTLIELNYPKLSHKINATNEEKSYNYLLDMTIFNLSQRGLNNLIKTYNTLKQIEHLTIHNTEII